VLWSRSLELFAPLGLTQAFIDSGNKAKGGSVYADGKRIVHFGLTGDDSPFGFPLMIPQNETERVLSEHLQNHGATIERQVELVSFVEGPDSVVCQLRDADGHEESVETSWVIGCDAAHSTVRKCAGMPLPDTQSPMIGCWQTSTSRARCPRMKSVYFCTQRAPWFSFRSLAIDFA
jgi:2-polyprenyl-6-methoxyphenol hydroxylase-like FAD-dependent oxidoreductase